MARIATIQMAHWEQCLRDPLHKALFKIESNKSEFVRMRALGRRANEIWTEKALLPFRKSSSICMVLIYKSNRVEQWCGQRFLKKLKISSFCVEFHVRFVQKIVCVIHITGHEHRAHHVISFITTPQSRCEGQRWQIMSKPS